MMIGLTILSFVLCVGFGFGLYRSFGLTMERLSRFRRFQIRYALTALTLLAGGFTIMFGYSLIRGDDLFSHDRSDRAMFSDGGFHCDGDPTNVVRYHSCSAPPVVVSGK
jgi:hypothetical protein